MMRIGIAADHGGFELKVQLTAALKATGYEVADQANLCLSRANSARRCSRVQSFVGMKSAD